MNDLVFVMYNLKLKDRQIKKSIEMDSFEDIPSDDEWIANEGISCNEDIHEGEGDDGEGDFVLENEDEGVDGEGEGDDEDDEGMHLEEVPLVEDEDEDEDEDGDEEEATPHVEDHEFY